MESEKESDKKAAGNVSDADKISGNEERSGNFSTAAPPAAEQKPYEYKKHDFRPKSAVVEDRRNFLIRIYDKHYRKLLVLPAAAVVISVLILFYSLSTTGEFFQKDVSIKGGVTVTVLKQHADISGLEGFLTRELGKSVNVRRLSQAGIDRGIIID